MLNHHTNRAFDYFMDLLAEDSAQIWAKLDLLGDTIDTDKWKTTINHIAQDYLLTPRFALMRILCKRAVPELSGDSSPEPICYSVTVGQDLITHSNISLEHAKTLSAEEHINYIRHLMDIAGPSPDDNPDLHEQVICRAWFDADSATSVMIHSLPQATKDDPRKFKKAVADIAKENRKRYSTKFSREEAFQLGHILKFSLNEMQWFLMRVFQVEETGIRMNHSNDVIEVYALKTNATCQRTEQLKANYAERSGGIRKTDDIARSQNWTAATNSELLENTEIWARNPDSMDEKFMDWLVSKASGLDIPSRTALRLYRNLAAYAYAGAIPDEMDLLDEILHIAEMDMESEEAEECLYLNGQISEAKCEEVAEDLYYGNNVLSGFWESDSTKPWSVIHIGKDKKLSVSSGIVNSGRIKSPENQNSAQTRILHLLMGTSEVEKGDILYLLWYICNVVYADSRETNSAAIYDRIFDLKEAADALLNAALLPNFYVPHLMEQSMLLSIVYGGKTGIDPAEIYGTVIQSLRETRAKRLTQQEKLAIINEYRNDPRMTLKDCAEKYGTSVKNISRWQKELIDAKLIAAEDTTE